MFDFTYMVRKPEVRSLYVNDLKIPYLTIAEGSYIVKGHFETYTNDCNVLVGRYCSIAHDVTFLLSMNHDYNSVTTYSWDSGVYLNKFNVKSNPKHPKFNTNRRQIIIGNDVWIGRGVTIMGGVRIGNGAVIGAGAIVSKNIPPYSIVVGNPAKVIKYRFDSEIIRKLQAIRWWNWSTQKIVEEFSISDDPKTIIDRFYSKNLEIITKDSLGDHLRELKSRGFKIFSTIADFQAKSPIWKSIAEEFLKCNIDRAILCIHLRRDVSKDQMSDILKMIERSFNKKLIVALKSPDDRPFSLDSLRETDVFVTTCEDDCSKAIDAMSDLNFETRYIFDDLVFF